MARLRFLLDSERRAAHRRARQQRSGSERLLEAALWALLAFFLLRQLHTIAFGPIAVRAAAARIAVWALALAWLFLPSTLSPALEPARLALLPLSRAERLAFQLAARLQAPRLLALAAASLATLAACLCLPRPLVPILEAALEQLAAAALGLSWALTTPWLAARVRPSRARAPLPPPHPFPLFRKEFRAFARLVEPWLVLLLALAAALTEWLGQWMTPSRAALPFLLFAFFYLPAMLNPFGLETPPELARYRLFPLSCAGLVARKHAALLLLFFLSALPLLLALALRLPPLRFLLALLVCCLTLAGCLLAGLLWHNRPAARSIHLAAWSLSGSNMPLDLALESALLAAAAPTLYLLAAHTLPPLAATAAGLALLVLLSAAYRRQLRRCRWPAN